MTFTCEHCGRRLTVADGQAGKKGRCPQCKKVLTVPLAVAAQVLTQIESLVPEVEERAKPSPRNPLLFDMPPADASPQTPTQAQEELQTLRDNYLLKGQNGPRKRPLPWMIDVFLYPVTKLGLLILLLCGGIPFALRPLVIFSQDLTAAFMPGLFLLIPLFFAHWGSLLLAGLYINWYVAECIRDSAAGSVRAVDTTATTPGFGELFGQSLTVLACAGAYLGPAFLYAQNHDADPIFWTLFGVGGFLFPMALLAVTMFESLRALSPVLVVTSVFSAFIPYCLLATFCCAACLLPLQLTRLWFNNSWPLEYGYLFLTFYAAVVLAHLVGRFYWKYEERLRWDA
jgi:phage FluMu protein Com